MAFLTHYILNGHEIVEEPDLKKWAMWFETADRRVALTQIADLTVSTVFLGLDHNFGWRGLTLVSGGTPILFETMSFTVNSESISCARCATWVQAEAQHKRVCDQYREIQRLAKAN